MRISLDGTRLLLDSGKVLYAATWSLAYPSEYWLSFPLPLPYTGENRARGPHWRTRLDIQELVQRVLEGE